MTQETVPETTTPAVPPRDDDSARAIRAMVRAVPRSVMATTAALVTVQVLAGCGFAVLLARGLASLVVGTVADPGALAGAAVAMLVRAGAGHLLRRHCDTDAAERVRAARHELTDAVLTLGSVALSRYRASDIAALDAGLVRLYPVYARYAPTMVTCGISAVVIPLVLLRLDPSTGLIVVVTLPVTVAFLVLAGTATARTVDEQWQSHLRLGSRLVDITRNLGVVDAYGATPAYRRVFAAAADRHSKVTGKVLRSAFLNGFVLEVAAILGTALAAVWIGVRLAGGVVQLAPTMAALILVGEVFLPLRSLGAERHTALDAVPVHRQWSELVAAPPVRGGSRPVPENLVVRLQDCSAVLGPDGGPRLTVSGILEPGRPAVLRGPSGTGKSTLLAALAGHADYRGSLRVDGTQRAEMDLAAWREQVAYVPQLPHVVPGTVRDNVAVGAPDSDDDAITDALDAAGLGDVVAGFDDGLDTRLGEDGIHLSGGERARLALARVLVGSQRVVLLDEITAQLDPETAARVIDVVRTRLRDRVVLLATHLEPPDGWRELCTTKGVR